MTRFVSVCVAIAGVLAVGVPGARAELPNGAEFSFERLFITEDGVRQQPSTPDVLREYLNLAHCTCSQAGAGDETTFEYELKLTTDPLESDPAEVWVGSDCDDDVVRNTMCRKTDVTIPDIRVLATTPDTIELSLYDAINGFDNTSACRQAEGTATVWVLVDTDGNGSYDHVATQALGQTMGTVGEVSAFDTQPPPLPTEFTADSAEGAISLGWTVPTSRATDIFYYQALCAGPDGLPALETPIEPRYQTVRTLCGLEQDLELVASDIASDDTTPVTLPTPLAQLDPAYVCGETTDPTASGLMIDGLEDGVPYTVVLLAIDRYGNATGTYFTRTITPQPATDFWEDLHDRGSDVEGGFCLVSATYGDDSGLTQTLRAFRDDTLASTALGRAVIDGYYATLGALGDHVASSLALRAVAAIVLAPLVALALAWHALTLPGLLGVLALGWLWRRRARFAAHRRAQLGAAAGAATVGLIALAPATAGAQGPDPYWETPAISTYEDIDVSWHAGLRLGPYIPAIDEQFGMSPGPYDEMFGGSQILPMIDVDRVVWRGVGQLGIGGSIGYMQKTAKAWADGSTPGDPMRPRSPGDENTFRLLPLAATVVYRLTWFDDAYGIPLVPYLRGGLSYYLWWFTTNGDTSSACFDGTRDPDCDADKAIGGTIGVQGSVGLAIRAERIDADAAASMRAGGILHAGFYAELSLAKVDGFGSDQKLAVGDTTWFAGVDFEF